MNILHRRALYLCVFIGFIFSFKVQAQDNLNIDAFIKTYKAAEGGVLLDVRTPGEWKQGTLEDSKLINLMDASFKTQVQKLDKSKPIFVYCKVGGRSARASQILTEMGFKQVYNLRNAGYDDLAQKGLK